MNDSHRLCHSLNGDGHDADALLALLYQELKRLARSRVSRLPPGQTLQATALVHEAYLRLLGDEPLDWNGRAHFFGAAARAMRDIIVENARRKSREKHGGNRGREPLEEAREPEIRAAVAIDDVLALDEAIKELSEKHSRKAKVVELRYFGGLDIADIARLLDVSSRTIESDWRFARAWLYKTLRDVPEESNR